jgi:hypothetical protein
MQKEVDKVIELCVKDANSVDQKQILRAILFQNELVRFSKFSKYSLMRKEIDEVEKEGK